VYVFTQQPSKCETAQVISQHLLQLTISSKLSITSGCRNIHTYYSPVWSYKIRHTFCGISQFVDQSWPN